MTVQCFIAVLLLLTGRTEFYIYFYIYVSIFHSFSVLFIIRKTSSNSKKLWVAGVCERLQMASRHSVILMNYKYIMISWQIINKLDMSGKLGFDDYKKLRSDLMLCRVSLHCTEFISFVSLFYHAEYYAINVKKNNCSLNTSKWHMTTAKIIKRWHHSAAHFPDINVLLCNFWCFCCFQGAIYWRNHVRFGTLQTYRVWQVLVQSRNGFWFSGGQNSPVSIDLSCQSKNIVLGLPQLFSLVFVLLTLSLVTNHVWHMT